MKKNRAELLKQAVDIVISMRESEERLKGLIKIPLANKEECVWIIKKEERMAKDRREKWDAWYRRYGKFFVPKTKETLEHFAFIERGRKIVYSLKSTERAFEMAKNTREEVDQRNKDILEGEVDSERSKWQEFCRFLTDEEKEEIEVWGEEEVKKYPGLSEELYSSLWWECGRYPIYWTHSLTRDTLIT